MHTFVYLNHATAAALGTPLSSKPPPRYSSHPALVHPVLCPSCFSGSHYLSPLENVQLACIFQRSKENHCHLTRDRFIASSSLSNPITREFLLSLRNMILMSGFDNSINSDLIDFLAGREQPRSPPVIRDVALLQGSRSRSSVDDHTHLSRRPSRLAWAAMGNGSEK